MNMLTYTQNILSALIQLYLSEYMLDLYISQIYGLFLPRITSVCLHSHPNSRL